MSHGCSTSDPEIIEYDLHADRWLGVRSIQDDHAVSSVHDLNDFLGNHDGQFSTEGRNYAKSAHSAALVGSRMVASLRKIDQSWVYASLLLRAKRVTSPSGTLTHELSFESCDVQDPSFGLRNSRSNVNYQAKDWGRPRLSTPSVLLINIVVDNSHGCDIFETIRYDLDQRLGNVNGQFSIQGHGYSKSARNVVLKGTTLTAELRTLSGHWQPAFIDLNWVWQSCLLARAVGPPHKSIEDSTACVAPGIAGASRIYSPLGEKSRQFRLCYIAPGAWCDPVRCTILERSMDGPEKYACLSYVWGAADSSTRIVLNSIDMTVTPNLLHALRLLRWHGIAGAVWIDALCINQEDVDERTEQVAQMTNIYSKADMVIIAFIDRLDSNSPDDECGSAMRNEMSATIYRLVTAAYSQKLDTILDACVGPLERRNGGDRDRALEFVIKSIDRFAAMEWFTRVWTVQEHNVARHITSIIDGEVLDPSALRHSHLVLDDLLSDRVLASWLKRHNTETGKDEKEEAILTRCLSAMKRLADTLSRGLRNLQNVPRDDPDFNLLSLEVARHRQASDPRDKLFAFGRAAKFACPSFKIDYRLSAVKVFTDFTLGVMNRMGNLDVWMMRTPPFGHRASYVEDLPSWVVDWTTNPHAEAAIEQLLIPRTNRYPTMTLRDGTTMLDSRPQMRLPEYATFGAIPYNNASSQLRMPDFATYGGMTYDEFTNHFMVRGKEFDAIAAVSSVAPPAQPKVVDRIGIDFLLHHMRFVGLQEQEDETRDPILWNRFWRTMVANRWPQEETLTSWRAPDQQDELDFGALAAMAEQYPEGIPSSKLTDNQRRALRHSESMVKGRRLFKTKRGSLGRCPQWAQVNDRIFHMAGSRWPVILRPYPMDAGGQGEHRSLYTLVGMCHVQSVKIADVEKALGEPEDIYIL